MSKTTLSNQSFVFPSYQGESTIFHKGNFLKHTTDSKNLLSLRELFEAGTVAEWSRALVRNHSEWTVLSSNPGEGYYGDDKLNE